MAKKEKKTFIVATAPGNYIYQVNAVPTFPGRPFKKVVANRDIILDARVGEGGDLSVRHLNGDKYTVRDTGKMTYAVDDVILHEQDAAEVAAREAVAQVKAAKEEMEKLAEDIKVLEQVAAIYVDYAEKETLDFDKEGKIIVIKINK